MRSNRCDSDRGDHRLVGGLHPFDRRPRRRQASEHLDLGGRTGQPAVTRGDDGEPRGTEVGLRWTSGQPPAHFVQIAQVAPGFRRAIHPPYGHPAQLPRDPRLLGLNEQGPHSIGVPQHVLQIWRNQRLIEVAADSLQPGAPSVAPPARFPAELLNLAELGVDIGARITVERMGAELGGDTAAGIGQAITESGPASVRLLQDDQVEVGRRLDGSRDAGGSLG